MVNWPAEAFSTQKKVTGGAAGLLGARLHPPAWCRIWLMRRIDSQAEVTVRLGSLHSSDSKAIVEAGGRGHGDAGVEGSDQTAGGEGSTAWGGDGEVAGL